MSSFTTISEKVHAGERLSEADALFMYASNDLSAIGELAAMANERLNGRNVYFNVNRHINPTNICVNRCRFCAFSRTADAADAYTLAIDEMAQRAVEAQRQGATEVHLVGGLHPDLPFSFYLELLREIRLAAPLLHIKAFTAVEIEWFATIAGMTITEVLAQLMEVGLGSMPGGGAEILVEEVRSRICPEKISGRRWLDIHRQAHQAGLKTNCTMLYGHLEKRRTGCGICRFCGNYRMKQGGFRFSSPWPGNRKIRRSSWT